VTFLETGNIVISNQQAERLIGLSRARLLGESFFNYIEESDKLETEIAALSKAEGQANLDDKDRYWFRAANGDKRELEIMLVLTSDVENKLLFTAILRLPN